MSNCKWVFIKKVAFYQRKHRCQKKPLTANILSFRTMLQQLVIAICIQGLQPYINISAVASHRDKIQIAAEVPGVYATREAGARTYQRHTTGGKDGRTCWNRGEK